MIQELNQIADLLFKNKNHPSYTNYVNDTFQYFGKNINKPEDPQDFWDDMYNIIIKYRSEINTDSLFWVDMKHTSSNPIPYKLLWDIFEKEKEKHKK